MKKFLIFFMVMFGMACSAMAVAADVKWPYDAQANRLVGDGFIEMIIHYCETV